MERTITVDGKEVRLRASAAIPRLYRLKFRRDIIQDMQTIKQEGERIGQARKAAETKGGKATDQTAPSPLPLEALTMFENVAYLMAKHADQQNVPGSVDEWLDGFNTFSIYQVFPVIQELWSANLESMSTPAKK